MKLVPVVVLVDDESLARMTPLIGELADRWSADCGDGWKQVMTANGWTPEMVAWSLVIAAASRQDLELGDASER